MLLVVGGHSRNIGKTSVVEGLIRRFRQKKWTALKITQYGHGVCAGEACGCETEPEHPFALSEEYVAGPTDSGRFLAAGAERSLWLRTPMGELARAQSTLAKIVHSSANLIVEIESCVGAVGSGRVLDGSGFFVCGFQAVEPAVHGPADAFVVIDRGMNVPLWEAVARGVWDRKPRLVVEPPSYVTAAVSEFVRSRLSVEPSR